jgi:sugar lactone lactonase YvrE
MLLLAMTLNGADIASVILERGSNHRLMRNESGGTYTELADGLCYQDLAGNWFDSEELFEIIDGTAVARRGQHRATLAANINSERVVELIAPDGRRFVSRIAGLSYLDAASGQNVLVAQVQDSIGVVHPPNQVIYPAALVGEGFTADVRYTWRKGGFAQDVIVRESPPPPEAYSLNPATTRLQAWTIFLEAPEPEIEPRILRAEQDQNARNVMAEPDFTDQELKFGAFRISMGRAFSLDQNKDVDAIPVGKEWGSTPLGQTFLIESLEYPPAKPSLDALPVQEARLNAGKNATVAGRKLSRPQLMAALTKRATSNIPGTPQMQLAKAPASKQPGFLIDYETLYSGYPYSYTHYTFAAGKTYFITGDTTFYGTTTFEGGSVIKLAPYVSGSTIGLRLPDSTTKINCVASPWNPFFITAKDDNTVGETIVGSTGTPSGYYGSTAIYRAFHGTPLLLSNARIRYAYVAVNSQYCSATDVRHSQFVNCGTVFQLYYTTVYPRNVLVSWDPAYSSGVLMNADMNSALRGENMTIHRGALRANTGIYPPIFLTNCLMAIVTGPYTSANTFNSASDAGIFQTVGAGSHYLAGDAHRNVGTSVIDPTLLAELRARTTYPPTVLFSHFTAPAVLMPATPRDSDGIIDRGYHYDVIDFAWGERNLSSSLLLTNGVVVAHYSTRGTTLEGGAAFISEGSPTARNRLVPYNMVQENATVWGVSGSTFALIGTSGTQVSPPPEVYLRFTDVAFPAGVELKRQIFEHGNGNVPAKLLLRDCDISAGYLIVSNSTASATPVLVGFTNNLFRRTEFTLRRDDVSGADKALIDAYAYNNLFLNSTLRLLRNTPDGTAWRLHDNLFDTASLTFGSGTINKTHNGYLNTSGYSAANFDKQISARDYLPGPLGTNYYPASGANLFQLVNAGSRAVADSGLFHHTVKPSQTKAGDPSTPNISIGYHYVAMASDNVALRRYAYQSSTATSGEASKAVDGNTAGMFPGSVSQTLSEVQPWWELDLGQIESIQSVNLWKRTDCCPEQLSNFYLLVSEQPFTSTTLSATLAQAGVSSYQMTGAAGTPSTFVVNRTARYVRVQLASATAQVLSLAEVQVNTAHFPADTERDGLPDYFEDNNGDGLVSAGETDHKGPIVTITAPLDGFAINTSRINVQGNITHAPMIKDVAVNGVRGFLTGTAFEGRNVSLAIGANLVLVTATDIAENSGSAMINISGVPTGASLVDPVVLASTPASGFAPLNVSFQVTSAAPGTFQDLRYDFHGNNVYGAPITTSPPFPPAQTTYAAGEYFPVATIRTSQGSFSSSGGWNSAGEASVVTAHLAPQTTEILITDPVDVKAAPGGGFYVLSRSGASITQYDSGGNVVRSVSGIGSTPNGFDVDVAGRVYVAVSGANQVKKYAPNGVSFQLDTAFNGTGRIGKADGTVGTGPGEFNSPYDVAVTSDGQTIFVSDSGNHRIQKFTRQGTHLLSIGSQGSGIGQFTSPKGLSFSRDDALFVVDSGNHRITELLGDAAYNVFGSGGASLGQYQSPLNVSVDVAHLYIADTGNNRIQKIERKTSSSVLQISSTLNQPAGVSVADDPVEERLYIANTGNNRVLILKLPQLDPTPVWETAKQNLIAGQVESALLSFSRSRAGIYRSLFTAIGATKVAQDMSGIPALTPLSLTNDEARYYFTRLIDGQTFGFIVTFEKENGSWKIRTF